MSDHICARCGREDHCGYGSWPDRHPVLATVGGLVALMFMGCMFSVYTSAAFTMVALAGGIVAVRALSREWRRRRALATRAQWEHEQLVARQAMPDIRLAPRDPISPQPQSHIVMPPPYTQPINRRLR